MTLWFVGNLFMRNYITLEFRFRHILFIPVSWSINCCLLFTLRFEYTPNDTNLHKTKTHTHTYTFPVANSIEFDAEHLMFVICLFSKLSLMHLIDVSRLKLKTMNAYCVFAGFEQIITWRKKRLRTKKAQFF